MTVRPFISYAREDRDVAVRLRNDLVRLGATPWIDVVDLVAGQNWPLAISRALRQSSHFVALLSEHSVTKRGYVQREVREALELLDQLPPDAIFIIPVRIDDSEPAHDRLKNLHRVDLFAGYDRALREIARGLGLPNDEAPEPVPLKVVPVDVPVHLVSSQTGVCPEMSTKNVYFGWIGPDSGCTSLHGDCKDTETISFQAYATAGYSFGCSLHSFTWDFDDGSPTVTVSGTTNIQHKFRAAGTFNVTLTISNAAGGQFTLPAGKVRVANATGVVP